jgi:DNA polymerase alpha-associated DNA helicase A
MQTGKTHTLVELILQLLARPANSSTSLPPRILIATPSNLALDNILLRLQQVSTLPEVAPLLPPGSLLRLGHPTRVHKELLTQTLDWRAANGNDGEVVRGVKEELEGHMSDLSKKRGEKGAVKGKDRGVKWQEIRELRKEYALAQSLR